MMCSQCDKQARAACAFCGRAVCEDHWQAKDLYTGFGRIAKDAIFMKGTPAGVIVRAAIWCGVCKVEYQPTY